MAKRALGALALVAAALPLPGGSAQASGGGGGGGEGLHLVPMDEITVPIVDADRVQGSLRFKVVLEATDEAAAAKVTAELPMLRSAALSAGLEFARLEASPLRAVDAGRLDHDLTAALKEADQGLSRVLIVEVAANRT